MADEIENRRLMETTRGTPMGELLRRYWQPIAAVGELDASPTKPVRLLGEDLVLYRDGTGRYGLLEAHCAHRRADLSYGIVEAHGLRCTYHGWLYDASGQCIAQPFEDTAHPELHFKDRIKLQAYPVEAKGGLLWAYLGPSPAPLVPDWEPFSWDDGLVQLVFTEVPCNWFQGQENSIDPVHVEWLHSYWSREQRGRQGPPPPTHLRIGFDEFEYGYQYKRIVEGQSEDHPMWTNGRTCLWPNALVPGAPNHCHFEWRVPIDDGNMLSVGWFFDALAPGAEFPGDKRIVHWNAPLTDAQTGRWIGTHTMNQDYIAWVGQGQLAEREKEHLSPSDRGIILLRQKFLEQMELVARGEDPWVTFRDPAANYRVPLPMMQRERLGPGLNGPDGGFTFLAGQPPEVREIFQRVRATWRGVTTESALAARVGG